MKHLLLFFALLFASVYCYSQCSENFVIKSSDTCLDGNNFSFIIDYTTYCTAPVTHSWNFGDNSKTDTSANPTHSYKKAGGYFVSLSTKAPNGSSIVYQYLTVYPSPVVAPIVADTVLCANQGTYFKDTTPGGVFSFSGKGGWILKDTDYAIPSDTGIYTISYKVTNAFGCAGISNSKVVVSENKTPSINIIANNNPLCTDSCATFKTSSILYGGTKPTRQWQLNGLNVGTGDSVYSYCRAKNGDTVSCLLASSYNGCLSSRTANSNIVTIETIAPPRITGDSILYIGNKDTLHTEAFGNVWKSSNTAIATVDSNGIVTAQAAGVVTILDTMSYSCGKTLETFKIIVYNLMPVAINEYKLTATDTKAVINSWHTSNELNTSHFGIQHSTDGTSFTTIGTVKAIGSGANGYEFIDNNPANGTNYYRLESVDRDGASSFSKVVSAEIVDSKYEIVVVPNPVKSVAIIKGNHIALVQVIDNIGRVVKTVTFKDATNPTLSVSALPTGVYQLRIQTTDGNLSGVGMVKE